MCSCIVSTIHCSKLSTPSLISTEGVSLNAVVGQVLPKQHMAQQRMLEHAKAERIIMSNVRASQSCSSTETGSRTVSESHIAFCRAILILLMHRVEPCVTISYHVCHVKTSFIVSNHLASCRTILCCVVPCCIASYLPCYILRIILVCIMSYDLVLC